ncbi:MAG TPA: hypothetical protein PKH93_12825, partial [Chitinophagales bacterium]|nr:hypothetical protein [Chitinophagales bacterium]
YNNGRIERIAFKNDFAKNIKVYYGNNNEIIKISQNGTNLNSIKFVFNYNINKIERIVLSLHPEHNIKFHYNNDSTIYNVSNNNSKITFYYENNAFIKTRGTIDNYNVEIVNFTDTW